MRTHDRDRALDLREAIHRTGYYPDVVADGVAGAVAGEDVVSFYVHHEPTFDRDEIRRHLTVVVLTPSRLIVAHTDEHAADDLIPEAYTSTSTEAIALSTVRSVVVTRMVTNPTSGPAPAAEAVVTIGWGGVSRIDLEPAGCQDPDCEADHGYTGVLASDDFSIRASATADGSDAVASLLAFAESLSARTQGRVTEPCDRASGFVEPAYGNRSLVDVVPAVGAAIGVKHRSGETGRAVSCCRKPRRTSCSWSTVSAPGCCSATPTPRRTSPRCSPTQEPGTAGVPSTTATSLSSLGTACRRGRTGWSASPRGSPAPTGCSTRLRWDKNVDPQGVAAARHGVHGPAAQRRRGHGDQQAGVPRQRADVAAHRGADFVGADRVGERIAAAVVASAERPSLTYLYDGDLDWTGHRYGVASAQWLQQLVMVDAEAEQLRESLPADVRLLVVADHGMVDSPPGPHRRRPRAGAARRVGADGWRGAVPSPLLPQRRRRPTSRRPGARSSATGPTCSPGRRRSARGWFGPVDPLVLPRLGDVVVACRGDHAVVSSADFAYEATLIGLHGSLTADEMLIPMLVD